MSEHTGSDVNRREALRAVGGGIAGISGLSSVASADSRNESNRIRGDEQDEVVERLQRDPDVKRLVRFANSRNWAPQFTSTSVFTFDTDSTAVSEYVERDSDEMYTAVVPFEQISNESNDQLKTTERMELIWNSATIKPTAPKSRKSVFMSEVIKKKSVTTVNRYHVTDGEVRQLDSESVVRETEGVTTESTCGTGDFKLYCEKFPKTSCILTLLGNSIGCTTCLFGNIAACISCALGQASFNLSGCIMDRCTVVCVKKYNEPSDGAGYVPESDDHLTCDGPTGPGGICRDYSLT